MMKIKWLIDASEDLHEIYNYIYANNPKAAKQIINKITKAIGNLKENPSLGRAGRVMKTRELIINNTSYLVPYRVKNDTVEILRVLHHAKRWPREI